ncbi:MAG: hypothetical protein PHQ63_08110 [Smithellaceae bacterium]|nr:hypothetical protein [Smithellaceae bacterium]
MKKQTGHCISVVCAMGVVALSSVMVMADETIPSETIPVIEEIENEGGSSGGLLLFALFFCIAIGAVIGYFAAMRHAKKLYVEDYVYNNEEEVTTLAAKMADKVKAKKEKAEKAKAAVEEKTEKQQMAKEAAEKKRQEAQLQKEARIEKNREITLRKKERLGKAASIKPEKAETMRSPEPAPAPAPLPDLSGLIEGEGVDYAGRKFYYDPKDPTGGVDPFYFEGTERKYYD